MGKCFCIGDEYIKKCYYYDKCSFVNLMLEIEINSVRKWLFMFLYLLIEIW